MAKKKMPPMSEELRAYFAQFGREGGKAQVPKGTAMMSDEKRREIAMKGVEARKKKAGKKAPKKG